jgi:DNA-binding transcriptional LysR family regulator
VNLRHFEVLRAVWQSGSTTEAARMLRVSQPAISKMLREAEEQLGFRVFDRKGGRLKTRAETESLISAIERVFLDVESIHLLAARMRAPQKAAVRVAGLASFTQTLVPLATAAFRDKHRDAAVGIYSLQAEEVVDWVASGKADLGVIQSGTDHNWVQTLSSFQTKVVCAMPPDHPLAKQKRVELQDLRHHTVISYHLNEPSTLRMSEAFREAGETLSPALTVSNAGTAVALVERGVGVALITPLILSTRPTKAVVLRDVHPAIRLKLRIVGAPKGTRPKEVQDFALELRRAAQTLIGVPPDEGGGA